MSIPLDNLYEYLESLINEYVYCYLFRPHGSKNILDLHVLRNYTSEPLNEYSGIKIVFHDQEPLQKDYLLNNNFLISSIHQSTDMDKEWYQLSHNSTSIYLENKISNSLLESRLIYLGGPTIWDFYIIVHGDYGGDHREFRQNNFIPVFCWSHALISLDWFRFARYDVSLTLPDPKNKKFLIYCRDWTGSREYRLKFQELLFNSDLLNSSQTSISKSVDGISINDYVVSDPKFDVSNRLIFKNFNDNTHDSDTSARYNSTDFTTTDISIILETVFDVNFVSLTEKTLRAIACGHPFIVVGPPESLEFLKKYGFKTFSPLINEEYDKIKDPAERLNSIISTMGYINHLPENEYQHLIKELSVIAEFNRRHFFSEEFFNLIISQYTKDIHAAITQEKQLTTGKKFLAFRKIRKSNLTKFTNIDPSLARNKILTLRKIRQQNGIYRKPKPTTDQ